jgi:NAD(P)H-dependent FMN reductase
MLPHLRDVLTDLGCVVVPAMVAVPVAHTAFDEADHLRDANIAAYLNKAMAQFAAEVRLRAPSQRIAA